MSEHLRTVECPLMNLKHALEWCVNMPLNLWKHINKTHLEASQHCPSNSTTSGNIFFKQSAHAGHCTAKVRLLPSKQVARKGTQSIQTSGLFGKLQPPFKSFQHVRTKDQSFIGCSIAHCAVYRPRGWDFGYRLLTDGGGFIQQQSATWKPQSGNMMEHLHTLRITATIFFDLDFVWLCRVSSSSRNSSKSGMIRVRSLQLHKSWTSFFSRELTEIIGSRHVTLRVLLVRSCSKTTSLWGQHRIRQQSPGAEWIGQRDRVELHDYHLVALEATEWSLWLLEFQWCLYPGLQPHTDPEEWIQSCGWPDADYCSPRLGS